MYPCGVWFTELVWNELTLKEKTEMQEMFVEPAYIVNSGLTAVKINTGNIFKLQL